MGKGNRNRQTRVQEQLDAPVKTQKKKKHRKPFHAPKWLLPVIAGVLVLAIAFGIVYSALNSTGMFERNRIIVKSNTGKYDINQQIATYIAWQNAYYSSYYYYMYCQMGLYTDTNNITKQFKADEYALLASQQTISQYPRDCIDDIATSLRQYVAVCDEADLKGVALDAKDLEAVEQELQGLLDIKTTYEGYVSENQGVTIYYENLEDFLKDLTGINMKEEDVRTASKLITLYNKYYSQVEDDLEAAVTLEDCTKYRDENLSSFYMLDYLTYTTTDKNLADALKAATTDLAFKKAIVDSVFENKFKAPAGMTDEAEIAAFKADLLNTIYNELFEEENEVKGTYLSATEKLKALSDKLAAEGADISALLTEAGAKALADVDAPKAKAETATAAEGDGEGDGEATVPEKVEVPTEIKTLLKDADVSIGKILTKDNYLVYITAVKDGKVDLSYVKFENDTFVTMKTEFIEGTKTANGTSNKDGFNDTLPKDQTQSFTESATAGTYSAWLCEKGEGLSFTRKNGDTTVIEKTETNKTDGKETTSYSVYLVIKEMYFDTETVINGGYYKISSATRDADAENIKSQLAGLTGKALTEKLTELSNSSATVNIALDEETLTKENSDLSKWLFHEDRKDGDVTVIKGEKDTYVVVFTASMEAWKRTATTSVTNQRVDAWQTALAANYVIDEKVMNKIGESTTTAATTAAAA